jgi:hypothetical protein
MKMKKISVDTLIFFIWFESRRAHTPACRIRFIPPCSAEVLQSGTKAHLATKHSGVSEQKKKILNGNRRILEAC